MSDALDRLMSDLNRREIIDWLPDMKIGRPAYDRIRSGIESSELTSNQHRNAMHALFRLRGHGDDQEVFDVFVRSTAHPDKKVRTEALKLAIGLLRLPQCRVVASPGVIAVFREAVAAGVAPEVEALSNNFLSDTGNA